MRRPNESILLRPKHGVSLSYTVGLSDGGRVHLINVRQYDGPV